MHEPFILPVIYKGAAYEFKAGFERYSYAHRIAVLIGETTVTFEPDEEGSYRALRENPVELDLLRTIVEKLVQLNR